MKEKIWMEKLIELLNEYEREKIIHRTYYLVSWYIMYKRDDGEEVDDKRTDLEIISKSYGFIKWLVDNDKIDLENLQCVFSWNINKWKTLMEETDGYEIYEWTEYEDTESLIMLLSISDTPIEDLISYLK